MNAPDTPSPDELEIVLVGRRDSYTVVMETHAQGQRSGAFDAPLSGTELESFRSALDPSTQAQHLDPARVLEHARNLGERLLTALTADRELLANFTSARAAATGGGRELRVKIQTQGAPDLTAVPWELLYERPRFLAQTPRLSVVRYANLGDQLPLTPPVIEGPVRILGMVSRGADPALPPLKVEDEQEKLREAVAPLIEAGKVELRWLEKPTLRCLQDTLSALDEVHVFHFIGHGRYDEDGHYGTLMLEHDNGRQHPVRGEDLANTLTNAQPKLRLAVLNACEGARSAADNALASVAGSLMVDGVPAVIGMQFAISDRAAIRFTSAFYRSLAAGRPVDTAVTEARRDLFPEPLLEWATPVLFTRVKDGRLFSFGSPPSPPSPAARNEPPSPPLGEPPPPETPEPDTRAVAANNLGRTLKRRGDLEGAEAAFRRASDGGHAAAANNLGILLKQRGDLAGAEQQFRLGMRRGHPAAGNNLGILLKNRGDVAGADAAFRSAMQRGHVAAANNLGILLKERGDLAGAEAAFGVAAEHGHAVAANNLGILLKTRGDLDGSVRAFRRSADLGFPTAANNLGIVLKARGDLTGAERAFRQAADGGHAAAANNLGILLKRRGDLDGAEEAFRRAADGGHAAAANNLGLLLMRRGDEAGAEAAFRRAAGLD